MVVSGDELSLSDDEELSHTSMDMDYEVALDTQGLDTLMSHSFW